MVHRTAWLIAFLLLVTEAWAFHGAKDPLPNPQIGKIRQDNFDNLGHLKAGMTREQVSAVMGEMKDVQTYFFSYKADIVSNPLRIETLRGKDQLQREVRYYYAYQKKNDRIITTDECCPVVFLNGFLEGWGWEYFEKTIGPPPVDPGKDAPSGAAPSPGQLPSAIPPS